MCCAIRPGRLVLTEHLIDNLTVIWLLTYLAKWINKSLSHTALEGPMHHSCLASHLSSESTPLLGMGNVKPPPNFYFSFKASYVVFIIHIPLQTCSLLNHCCTEIFKLSRVFRSCEQSDWWATMMWAQGKMLKKVMQTKPKWMTHIWCWLHVMGSTYLFICELSNMIRMLGVDMKQSSSCDRQTIDYLREVITQSNKS